MTQKLFRQAVKLLAHVDEVEPARSDCESAPKCEKSAIIILLLNDCHVRPRQAGYSTILSSCSSKVSLNFLSYDYARAPTRPCNAHAKMSLEMYVWPPEDTRTDFFSLILWLRVAGRQGIG